MARRQRNKPTDAERDARRNEDRERFEEAVSALLSSEGWERWMRTRRCFRTYSVTNQLLVALQRPQATRVAGFRAWLSLNRCVRTGERGIRIFAPMPVKERDAEGTVVVNPKTGKPQTRTLFKSVAVFDTLSRARAVGLSSGAVGRLEALSGGRTPCSFRRRGAGEEPRRGDKPVPRRICCLRVLSRWGGATLVAPGPGRRG